MATSSSFIDYVYEQLSGIGSIRYKKMFGEYLIYINEKPVVIVCDNTVFIKKIDEITEIMQNNKIGYPYKGAKEHYILDIDNANFSKMVVSKVEKVMPLPKKKTDNK